MYFQNEYRGASAHYFVDEKSIWQVVEERDNAWHVGGAKTYYNSCRNNNSIGIELCCKKTSNGKWYFEEVTIENAVELAVMVMQKNGIDLDHCVRHADVTGKRCPEPFVRDQGAWRNFKNRIEKRLEEKNMAYDTDGIASRTEKEQAIMDYYNLDSNTIRFFNFYKYAEPLIDKLYYRTQNQQKTENH